MFKKAGTGSGMNAAPQSLSAQQEKEREIEEKLEKNKLMGEKKGTSAGFGLSRATLTTKPEVVIQNDAPFSFKKSAVTQPKVQ